SGKWVSSPRLAAIGREHGRKADYVSQRCQPVFAALRRHRRRRLRRSRESAMSLDFALILAAIVVLLLLSAFFNASETALTAVSRARMHALEQEGNTRPRLVHQLLPNPPRLLCPALPAA